MGQSLLRPPAQDRGLPRLKVTVPMAVAALPHYLRAMPLPRPARPRALWNDARAFWKGRPRHQWLAGMLAVAIPIAILFSFYLDSYTNVRPRQTIYYVDSWPASRTDAEIRAKQKADLELRRARSEEHTSEL